MRVNLCQVLKDYEGNDITYQDYRGSNVTVKLLDLRTCFIQALNTLAPTISGGVELQTAEDKTRIYGLSVKIYNASDEIDLTESERQFIKERVGIIWSANVYGRVSELLEGINAEAKQNNSEEN